MQVIEQKSCFVFSKIFYTSLRQWSSIRRGDCLFQTWLVAAPLAKHLPRPRLFPSSSRISLFPGLYLDTPSLPRSLSHNTHTHTCMTRSSSLLILVNVDSSLQRRPQGGSQIPPIFEVHIWPSWEETSMQRFMQASNNISTKVCTTYRIVGWIL